MGSKKLTSSLPCLPLPVGTRGYHGQQEADEQAAPACPCLKAPEAIMGSKKLTSSLDIYAFGIMMYEVYVGQAAYRDVKARGGKPAEEVCDTMPGSLTLKKK